MPLTRLSFAKIAMSPSGVCDERLDANPRRLRLEKRNARKLADENRALRVAPDRALVELQSECAYLRARLSTLTEEAVPKHDCGTQGDSGQEATYETNTLLVQGQQEKEKIEKHCSSLQVLLTASREEVALYRKRFEGLSLHHKAYVGQVFAQTKSIRVENGRLRDENKVLRNKVQDMEAYIAKSGESVQRQAREQEQLYQTTFLQLQSQLSSANAELQMLRSRLYRYVGRCATSSTPNT